MGAGKTTVEHPAHAHWRANTGAHVSLDLAPAHADSAGEVDVLSWNVAIGKGRLRERIRSIVQTRAQVARSRPFLILVQEAFRADDTVPEVHASEHHGGLSPRTGSKREDIADVARELNLSLRYAPSMRNGPHRSDRGNAILSSVPIEDTAFITLPFVRQHRAVVAAQVSIGNARVWLASAHLDTRGRHRPDPLSALRDASRSGGFGAGRAAQADALAQAVMEKAGADASIVIGADLNSYIGLRDPAVRRLMENGFRHAERIGRWRHTFHGPLRLMLDHVVFRPGDAIASLRVRRLDEGMDRGRRVFGSDHHPLLATITLR